MEKAAKEIVFVEGMTCSSCAGSVTKTMTKLGLKNVDTNYITGEVRYENDIEVSFEEIKKAVDGIGYHATGQKKVNDGKLSAIEKKFLFTLPFSAILLLHMFFPHDAFINHPWFQFSLCLPVFIIALIHFGKSAYGSVKAGFPNMDVLIVIGVISAFSYSLYGAISLPLHEAHAYLFFETAAVITTLVLLGNVIEHRSVKQTTTAIEELVKLQQVKALLVVGNQISEINAEQIVKFDLLQINEGNRVPADARITEGSCWVDESMLTGEFAPVEKKIGDEIIGGTIITKGNVKAKAIRTGNETVLAHIIRTVQEAQISKPPIQKLADKISAIFVPVVLIIAISTFLLSFFVFDIGFKISLLNSIAVLVISCPCAMGLATPTAVTVGLGKAAKNGVMIKGGDTFESLSKIKTIILDKTGTLTTGKFSITDYYFTNENERKELLNIIYHLEGKSSHPIAVSVAEILKENNSPLSLIEVEELKGQGIKAVLNNETIQLGSSKWLGHLFPEKIKNNFSLFLIINNEPKAALKIADEIKSDARATIEIIKSMGIHPILLSGDKENVVESLARECGITEFYFEKNPIEKLEIVKSIHGKTVVAMVGDGINDAPSLAQASVGISFGNASQVAINSAQVVLLNKEKLTPLLDAIAISKMTIQTVKQNLFWAFFYNVIAIPVAAIGYLNPMIGALSMAFSDVMVIGNSIRLRFRKIK